MKEQSGKLTRDAQRFIQVCEEFNGTITEPFDQNMGGMTMSAFWNSYPRFTDTNNLSLVVFLEYSGFKILFFDLPFDAGIATVVWVTFITHRNYPLFCVSGRHGRTSHN